MIFNMKIVISLVFAFGIYSILSAKDETILQLGSVAPDFSLKTEKGDTVTLSNFKDSKYVVLIFYPGDQTPVCTKQLCAIRDDYSEFEKKNAVVFGVNKADAKSHQNFSIKNNFGFPLLIDDDLSVTEQYGAKGMMGAKRTVYVVGIDGKVIFAQRGKPDNSVILKAIP